jgi:hypothetical protein
MLAIWSRSPAPWFSDFLRASAASARSEWSAGAGEELVELVDRLVVALQGVQQVRAREAVRRVCLDGDRAVEVGERILEMHALEVLPGEGDDDVGAVRIGRRLVRPRLDAAPARARGERLVQLGSSSIAWSICARASSDLSSCRSARWRGCSARGRSSGRTRSRAAGRAPGCTRPPPRPAPRASPTPGELGTQLDHALGSGLASS